jgi:hypothetical protein
LHGRIVAQRKQAEATRPRAEVELLAGNQDLALALQVRDGGRQVLILVPEIGLTPALAGAFARTDTGNDEVVVFLRRGRGLARATFEADLESAARATTAAGDEVAPRDGRVERIDAGPADLPGEGGRGTLYRVTFVNDARHLGTARFRVVEPLADDAIDFAVRAWDARGVPVAACGGGDDAAGRGCRARVRRLALELTVGRAGGRQQTFRREIAVGEAW